MAFRRVTGTLGPVREGGIPAIPPRWRLPALLLTILVCIALFVTAVWFGLHG